MDFSKILDKLAAIDSKVEDQSANTEKQAKAMNKIVPAVSGISSTTDKTQKTLSKVQDKLSASIKTDKKTATDITRGLSSLNKRYTDLVSKGLDRLPKNLKDSIKDDKSLMKNILNKVQIANKKLSEIKKVSTTTAKSSKSNANVVVNVSGAGSSPEIVSLKKMEANVEQMKNYMKTLADTLSKDPLKEKEKSEDAKYATEDRDRELSRERGKKRGRKSNDEREQIRAKSLLDAVAPLLLGSMIYNFASSPGGGPGNNSLRAIKLGTSFLQKGGISAPLELLRSGSKLAGGLGKTVGKETTEVVAKEAAEQGAKSASKILEKTLSKEILEWSGKTGAKAAKVAGKTVGKKLPFVGLVIGAAFAAQRAREQDFFGAGLELASGIAAMVPGLGTMVSIGIDAVLVGRDIVKNSQILPEKMKKIADNMDTMTRATQLAADRAESSNSKSDVMVREYHILQMEYMNRIARLTESKNKYDTFKSEHSSIDMTAIENKLGAVGDLNEENISGKLDTILDEDLRLSNIEKEKIKKSGIIDTTLNQLKLREIEDQTLKLKNQAAPTVNVEEQYGKDVQTIGKEKYDAEYQEAKDTLVEYIKFFSKYTTTGKYLYDEQGKKVDDPELLEYARTLMSTRFNDIMNDPTKVQQLHAKDPWIFDILDQIVPADVTATNLVKHKSSATLLSEMDALSKRTHKPSRVLGEDERERSPKYVPKKFTPKSAKPIFDKIDASDKLNDEFRNNRSPTIIVESNPVSNTTNVSSTNPMMLQPLLDYNNRFFFSPRNA